MPNTALLNRREFTLQSALAILSGVVITITGCGKVDYSPPTAPSSTPSPSASGDVAGSISANHGHVAVITRAQLTAGGGVALDIQGSSDHSHSVELSQSDIAAIANGQRVSKVSSVSMDSSTYAQHEHTVTFN
jgi:hypothetical protein